MIYPFNHVRNVQQLLLHLAYCTVYTIKTSTTLKFLQCTLQVDTYTSAAQAEGLKNENVNNLQQVRKMCLKRQNTDHIAIPRHSSLDSQTWNHTAAVARCTKFRYHRVSMAVNKQQRQQAEGQLWSWSCTGCLCKALPCL